ncbi:unnamed protein product [Lactuca virosa]|uniref:VQ domain-containing protein n=1 Tax=Lactuca virosa TaxID=75947 RepID=A0AAU9PUR1_9ASTR|nr:unnamed protein product [Lactuca virosa]CAH1454106.1 unnamed protein product [Lactuca virosa]
MDSGNSGSLQSSSGCGDGGVGGGGCDEVYDSRTESVFLNPPPTQFNHMPMFQQPPPSSSSSSHHQPQPPSTFFDPSSFSQPLNPNTNPMYNLDSLWSRNQNSMYNLDSQQDPYLNPTPVDDNINPDTETEKVGHVTTKNPKKRTRASRRAPTTVLTTDTTNFRQMVQEFTGIPAAPFSTSSSSSPFSRRIDLYGGGLAPLNPIRPSAQKIQLQQQPTYLNSTTATTSNFQLPPAESHLFTKQPLNLSNLQRQMFQFQSLSQTRLPQQSSVIEGENHRSEPPNAFASSSSTSLKRWRGQDETLMNLEGERGNSQNVVVSSRSDGDQLPGNEDSWICPSD